jgi:hypothetical protein
MTGPSVSCGRPHRPLALRWLYLALAACSACASAPGARYYDRYLVNANPPLPVLASLPADGSLVPAGTIENHGRGFESGVWPAARWRYVLKRAQEQQCRSLLFNPHRIIVVNFDADRAESGVLFFITGSTELAFAGVRAVCLKPPEAVASPPAPAP